MAKAFYEETTTEKDHQTGEIKTTKHKKSVRLEKEPGYIKLYINDLCKLNDIPNTGNNIINELLSLVNYDNEIALSSGIKNRICETLDIKRGTLDNNLTKLVNQWQLLKKIDTGLYMLNPNIFGKGNWQEVKALRVAWEYNEEGREQKMLQQIPKDKIDKEVA